MMIAVIMTLDERTQMYVELRTEVLLFAYAMEQKLRKNDHKGGWKNRTNGELWHKFHGEIREFDEAMINRATNDPRPILMEAVDIANYSMMIADNSGALENYSEEIKIK